MSYKENRETSLTHINGEFRNLIVYPQPEKEVQRVFDKLSRRYEYDPLLLTAVHAAHRLTYDILTGQLHAVYVVDGVGLFTFEKRLRGLAHQGHKVQCVVDAPTQHMVMETASVVIHANSLRADTRYLDKWNVAPLGDNPRIFRPAEGTLLHKLSHRWVQLQSYNNTLKYLPADTPVITTSLSMDEPEQLHKGNVDSAIVTHYTSHDYVHSELRDLSYVLQSYGDAALSDRQLYIPMNVSPDKRVMGEAMMYFKRELDETGATVRTDETTEKPNVNALMPFAESC